jgi:hypothetical protein
MTSKIWLVPVLALLFLAPSAVPETKDLTAAPNLLVLGKYLALTDAAKWSLAVRSPEMATPIRAISTDPVIQQNESQVKAIEAAALKVDSIVWISGNAAAVADFNGAKVVVISGLGSTTIHNSIRSTARTRASSVVSSAAMPVFERVGEVWSPASAVKYVATMFTYGVSNFVTDKGSLGEPETVLVVARVQDCISFSKGEISDADVLSRGAAFLAESGSLGELRRVSLELK